VNGGKKRGRSLVSSIDSGVIDHVMLLYSKNRCFIDFVLLLQSNNLNATINVKAFVVCAFALLSTHSL